MRALRSRAMVLVAFGTCTACSPQEWIAKAAESEEVRFTKDSADLLLRHDLESFARRLPSDSRDAATPETLNKVFEEIPPGQPGEPILVGYQSVTSGGSRQATVSLQYAFPGSFLLVQAQVASAGGPWALYGIHVERLPDSLDRLNAFRLVGKPALHYLVLACCIVVPAFVLSATVWCIRTPIPRRKWLWVVFVLFGLGQVRLNWTTGDVGVNPLYFQLFGAGAMRAGLYGPWFLTFSIPIGAAWFLRRRRLLMAASHAPAAPGFGAAPAESPVAEAQSSDHTPGDPTS